MQILRSIGVGLIVVTIASAQTPLLSDPATLLQSTSTRLLADMNRQPRYTCVQNTARQFFIPTSKEPASCATIIANFSKRMHDLPPRATDRFQLDVAIADNREIHSWPGETKFSEDEIRELVSNGPFGSGDFAEFIFGIFGGSATINFESPRTINGRLLFAYKFAVAKGDSHYEITADRTTLTAYEGSFLLDSQSGDLVQLKVHTAELPPETFACQAISDITYERVDIHGQSVLVPHQTNLRMIYRDGREALGVTSYSSCREYSGKTAISFDAAEEIAAPVSQNANPQSAFPEGLSFKCRIQTPIDSETPAGRAIESILTTPIIDKNGTTLAPRGAHIHGRLVRIAEHKSARDYFEVGIRLDSIEVKGINVPLNATLSRKNLPPLPHIQFKHTGDDVPEIADFPAELPQNIGVFFFIQRNLSLRQWDSSWRTISAKPKSEIYEPPQSPLPTNSAQQIPELETAQKFIQAIQYAQQAVDLLNAMPPQENLANYAKLTEILAARRKAIEVGTSLDAEVLNNLYPRLGDQFKSELLESLTLFVHGWDAHSKAELSRSVLLGNAWTDWYETHHEAIEEAVNSLALQSK